MMKITKTDKAIMMKGHAENKVTCAMMTALTVSLLNYVLHVLQIDTRFMLDDGGFFLDIENCTVEEQILVDAFWYSVKELSNSYPNSFHIVGETDYFKD